MKKATLAVFLFIASVLPQAQVRITGTWQAEVQPGLFWTVELAFEGTSLTGAVADDGGDPVEFYDGTVAGNTVVFKATSLFGQPTITFAGKVNGDEIEFTREIQGQGRPGPIPGILSPVGPRQFTARRVPDRQAPARGRGAPFPRRLNVYDRQGKLLQTLGEPDYYNWPVFSPDGTKLAVRVRGHIWAFDLSRGTRTRVTSPPWLAFAPAWSTNGRDITYFSWRDQSAGGVYRKASDGTGSEERLYETERGASVVIRDLSLDGRWLSFDSGNVLFVLPLEGERKATQLAAGEFQMRRARFSPDNRFLAYESDESGQFDVFIRGFDPVSGGFSPSGGKWQISKGGGGMAHWRRDGRELVYVGADGGVRAVDVSTRPAFRAGTQRLLFRASETLPPLAACFCAGERSLGTVSRDNQRFVFAEPVLPQRKEMAVAPEILSRYIGTYELFGAEVKITVEANQLVATGIGSMGGALVARERAYLMAQSETSFFVKDASGEIDFVNDEKGKVGYFVFYQGGGGLPTKAFRK
jgi:WD40-like Beta Propeller Repeat